MEFVACPLCESDSAKLFYDKERSGCEVSYVICRECGLVYQSPRMNQVEFEEYYKNSFRKVNLGDTELEEYINSRVEWAKSFCDIVYDSFYKNRFNRIKKTIAGNKASTLLDVGCGVGGIMLQFLKSGFRCKGIDMPSYYTTIGKNKLKLDIEETPLNKFGSSSKFDIIILNHTLEHFLDPVDELSRIHGLLKRNGVLYIEVPDIERPYPWKPLKYFFMLGHVIYYSATTLDAMLNKCGFTKVLLDNETTPFLRVVYKKKDDKNFVLNYTHCDKLMDLYIKEHNLVAE